MIPGMDYKINDVVRIDRERIVPHDKINRFDAKVLAIKQGVYAGRPTYSKVIQYERLSDNKVGWIHETLIVGRVN